MSFFIIFHFERSKLVNPFGNTKNFPGGSTPDPDELVTFLGDFLSLQTIKPVLFHFF